MKFKCLLAVCLLMGFVSKAQTMKIAHRSHSGSNSHFTINTTEGNFGETPEMAKKRIELKNLNDSLRNKAISDSIARVNAAVIHTEEVVKKAVADSVTKTNGIRVKKKKKKKANSY